MSDRPGRVLPKRILIVTGMSGAGRTTALKTFEDLGWEVVDNLPLPLLERLLGSPVAEGEEDQSRPLAFGVSSRTRAFDAERIVRSVAALREERGYDIGILFFDCAGAVLTRRYSETRRRHPLALDRPAADGIRRERELFRPIRDAADYLIDTSDTNSNALQAELRRIFASEDADSPTLNVISFGFSRGVPRHADLVFDMRFLRNPHWDPHLRPQTGLDQPVAAYVEEDSAYSEAVTRIENLLLLLLPRYASEGKSYVTIAFGCTGGRHRSVRVAEDIAGRLRNAAFSPTVTHRDLALQTRDAKEGSPTGGRDHERIG
ncbi:RNase adapter RapZ [Sphingomonas oleivorans]|uniref:RNase adapter RapZ n=1 Tax=Sphingomonas oleivorans TaxID=1735121 RepID=A0A2T5FWJ0_9SPHN|nr:RNase adapter RapZ [Sphingomonas oleivorans]PTQ10146.1 RNase adapter RapZ [Sphingomonas oleivorans]